MITKHQILLIQQSWELVKPISKNAGFLFYEKLFSKAPGIRHLFKDDITEQADKLMVMLSIVISKLNHLDDIIGDVQKLGQRHNQYGAKPEHYDVVGSCLIETLHDGLGEHWTIELQQAWLTAFTVLKNAMLAAQHSNTQAVA